MKYYFIGIKGSGMSALANVLNGLGYEVGGSDYEDYVFTENDLKQNGIKVNKFDIANLDGVDVVIVGHNFMNSDNIEFLEAKKRKMRILEYNEAVNEIIKKYYSIAVAGSNGKSSVTALIASVLECVEDTSYLIGSGEGKGRNSKYFTFEACEYKDHFLVYEPNVVLINNIDYDHVDYFKNENDYIKSFYNFLNNAKNIVVVNGDDKYLSKVNNVITFGIDNNSLIRAKNISYDKGIRYDLYCKNEFVDVIVVDMYGKHMVYNTLACISVCMSLGIDIEKIKEGLKNFKGVKRRFKETIINGDVYIDDYAHHPSKINAIIDAVKQKYKDREIIAFFRPDRVSRLNYFSSQFISSLKKADEFYVLPFIKGDNGEEYEKFIRENMIENLNESVYERIAKKKNVIYLMMSSKDMIEVKENILKYKG